VHAGEEDHTRPGWTTSIHEQESSWKSQSELQRTEINGESTVRQSYGKPSDQGRLKNRTEHVPCCPLVSYDEYANGTDRQMPDHYIMPSARCGQCSNRFTFTVPELAGCVLATSFNPGRPALVSIFAKFWHTAVPVHRHEVDGIFVGSAGPKNGRSEKSEVQLSLKESKGFLVMTTATE